MLYQSLIDMHEIFNPTLQKELLAEIRLCMQLAADMQSCLKDEGFIQKKADNSPVTLADITLQKRLERFFLNHTPDWPFIGEEGVTPWLSGQKKVPDTFWLCDPIDGTQDYATNGKEYAINLALIENGVPVFGLIAGPGRGTIAYMPAPNVVRFEEADGIARNLTPPEKVPFKKADLVVGHGRQKDVEAYEAIIKGEANSVLHCASALKFHALLLGQAQVYLRVRETSEWDIASGEALVRALGGHASEIDGKPFRYGFADRGFKLTNVFVSFTHEHNA